MDYDSERRTNPNTKCALTAICKIGQYSLYTYEYDSEYVPAMPVANIYLGRARQEPLLPLVALVDSGSDGTIIPVKYLKQIGARKRDQRYMKGVAGGRIQVVLYQVSIQIGDRTLSLIEVAGDKLGNETLLGRDILNQFIITLNDLASAVEIDQ